MTMIPPEWAPHKAIWTAWPSAADLWGEDLEPARLEVAAMIRALHDEGRGEPCACSPSVAKPKPARNWRCSRAPRSSPPPSATSGCAIPGRFSRATGAAGFRFNGWGGKYQLPHDTEVADQIARDAGVLLTRHDFILEGGAVEMDGEGTLLTTRQCLLNPNRNPDWDEAEGRSRAEARARR